MKKGHVYILRSEEGPVKIGISLKPEKRINEVGLASGREFVEVYVSPPLENYAELEKIMHFHFREVRLPGEWFAVKFEDAVSIAEHYGIKLSPSSWRESERYQRGLSAQQRLDAFKANKPSNSEIGAFMFGMGIAWEDAWYARIRDFQLAAGDASRCAALIHEHGTNEQKDELSMSQTKAENILMSLVEGLLADLRLGCELK